MLIFQVLFSLQINNHLCGCEISFSSYARNLGFCITDYMNIELHIKNICQSAYSELRRISTIWNFLSIDSTKTLASPLVLSRLDYVTRSFQAALNIIFKIYK